MTADETRHGAAKTPQPLANSERASTAMLDVARVSANVGACALLENVMAAPGLSWWCASSQRLALAENFSVS